MHIAIAGNIGSGKTTLTNLLCKHYGWKPHFEAVDNNPYLDDYYKDLKRWCFNLEVFFLKHRFKDVLEIAKSPKRLVINIECAMGRRFHDYADKRIKRAKRSTKASEESVEFGIYHVSDCSEGV